MRVTVDRTRCEGHGVCEDVAPEIYRLDEDGKLEILAEPVPAAMEKKAESGARLCPVAALTIAAT